MTPYRPSRGDVLLFELDPVKGHEQGGRRPALVVSNDILNHSGAEMVTVVPITSKERKLASYLRVEPPEGGLSKVSFIICDQVRTVSTTRILKTTGRIHPGAMREVETRLRRLLDL